MKKKTLFGSLIAGVMLVLVSIAPSINANVESLFTETPQVEKATPISLVLQLMAKLRNHPNIQNVETEDDVLQIIENDEELNSIVEQLSQSNDEDCGCEEESSSLEWRYPVLCIFLYPLSIIAVGILFAFHIWQFYETMTAIGIKLDCFWV